MANLYRNYLIAASATALLLFAACEGNLNQRMGTVSETIKKVDSAAENVSKGVTEFSKGVEGYVDTTVYRKDSNGIWQKKEAVQETKEIK